jgi:hypothetical protein
MKVFKSVIILLILFVLVFFEGCSYDRKVDYELSEKCEIKTEEFYKRNYADSNSWLYENHYNKKLNKCFILVTNSIKREKNLYDVIESKLYGRFVHSENGITCSVLGNKCNSGKEWDSLVKPYMED